MLLGVPPEFFVSFGKSGGAGLCSIYFVPSPTSEGDCKSCCRQIQNTQRHMQHLEAASRVLGPSVSVVHGWVCEWPVVF